ncbi:MAG TPA: rRNA pseudouridine synthase [Prolixibacteraceae bacterium]|nr:rRNA pseudouridine synthase [Prolixibacteraceae bacterium]
MKALTRKKVIVLKKKQTEIKPAGDGLIRLNKYISNAGICSRRDADKLIGEGLVKVNGEVVTELGRKVSLSDDIQFDGNRLNPEKKVYLLLNKPRGYATTVDDPHVERTVMQLIQNACTERVYPVGRLDMQTTGVLLFTNDGELAKKLTHPSYERAKIYHVQLDKDLLQEDMAKIAKGIELEDGFIAADDIQLINPKDLRQVGLEIHSGKNRIVRRIFNHLGYQVEKLDRVVFAGLTKKDLPRGRYRFLTSQEINFLKMS